LPDSASGEAGACKCTDGQTASGRPRWPTSKATTARPRPARPSRAPLPSASSSALCALS